MSDQITVTNLFGRIGKLFKRGNRMGRPVMVALPAPASDETETETETETEIEIPDTEADSADETADTVDESRTTFLRPWAERDQTIDQLQSGIATLSDLMGTIRESLEQTSVSQSALVGYLSHLPEALVSLPESNRLQGDALCAIQTGIEQQNLQQSKLANVLERMDRESDASIRAHGDALKALHLEIEQQNTQQNKLADVLERMDREGSENIRAHREALRAIQTGIEQQNAQQAKLTGVLERMHRDNDETARTLDVVRERVDGIAMHGEAIGQSLQSLGSALRSVSATSEASANVLENLQANICSRDNQLERVIRRQNTRFTTMLAVAIVLSMAALTSVVVFGYLGYEALSHMSK